MILSIRKIIAQAPIFAVMVVCVPGCDGDWAKNLDTGVTHPDFRFVVSLQEPWSKRHLFEQYEAIAKSVMLTEYQGQLITPATFEDDSEQDSFSWMGAGPSDERYRIRFIWDAKSSNRPRSFIVIVYNNSMNDFGAEEWLLFQRYQDIIIPNAFPKAHVDVLRHPAEFTSIEKLRDISLSTGISVPDEFFKLIEQNPDS